MSVYQFLKINKKAFVMDEHCPELDFDPDFIPEDFIDCDLPDFLDIRQRKEIKAPNSIIPFFPTLIPGDNIIIEGSMEEGEEAVSLRDWRSITISATPNTNIPSPPEEGIYVLTAQDGEFVWVELKEFICPE